MTSRSQRPRTECADPLCWLPILLDPLGRGWSNAHSGRRQCIPSRAGLGSQPTMPLGWTRDEDESRSHQWIEAASSSIYSQLTISHSAAADITVRVAAHVCLRTGIACPMRASLVHRCGRADEQLNTLRPSNSVDLRHRRFA